MDENIHKMLIYRVDEIMLQILQKMENELLETHEKIVKMFLILDEVHEMENIG